MGPTILATARRDLWHDSDVMPAARIFLQLIADFVVYLGLLIRRRHAELRYDHSYEPLIAAALSDKISIMQSLVV